MKSETEITIDIDDDKRESIEELFSQRSAKNKWDWYCNIYPMLLRLDENLEEINSRFTYEDDNKWTAVNVEGYASVLWAHHPIDALKYTNSKGSGLYSNGILVSALEQYTTEPRVIESRDLSADISITEPTILITDKDGRLPVNLQRDDLTEIDERLSGDI